jgi:hypothetical protein
MAGVTRTLRLVAVDGGAELGRLELLADGTIRTTDGAAVGVLAEMTREAGSEAGAWSYLTKYGWSNGYDIMIALADLDSAP